MADIIQGYISKVLVSQKTNNNDVIKINTEFLSDEGDVFTVERRAISPVLIQTTASVNELQPEVSTNYPYKIATGIDSDGSTILISPSIQTEVTASQNYYVPVYFERYNQAVVQQIDKSFLELQTDIDEDVIIEPVGFGNLAQ